MRASVSGTMNAESATSAFFEFHDRLHALHDLIHAGMPQRHGARRARVNRMFRSGVWSGAQVLGARMARVAVRCHG
jgi:hypothetical protein